ncbi:MAG: hypothetical protein ACPGU1_09210 [Myxococcota bacterium]
MTTDHVFYIPLVLLAGLVLGLFLGRRSLAVDQDEDAEREARREARRRRLAELDAQQPGDGP